MRANDARLQVFPEGGKEEREIEEEGEDERSKSMMQTGGKEGR